jgi:hypothetical protein
MMTSQGLSSGLIPPPLLAAKQSAAKRFLKPSPPRPIPAAFAVSVRPEHNVVGVGVGYKLKNGVRTDQHAVRLYVERKLPVNTVPMPFMLPSAINGIETEVIETGRFRALPGEIPVAQQRLRPARPGCSVGFQFNGDQAGFVMAGTLGAIVVMNGTAYLLSNNHVLANENKLVIGSPIFQPGLLDQGDPDHDQIAKLTKFIEINTDVPNLVDCAIAEILDSNAVQATVLPEVGPLQSADPLDAAEGLQVHKTGRTTGYTRGTIFDVSADVNVTYDIGTLTFENQVLIQGDEGQFSDAGDSGSLIVDRATQRAVGLLFAGSSAYTIANPITQVLNQLQVALKI